jgi:hypothetical protein
MNKIKEKVEAYVRSQIPELMELSFGCEVLLKPHEGEDMDMVNASISKPLQILSMCDGFAERIDKIIGHPIQLQHWLRVLEENRYPGIYPSVDVWDGVLTAISAEENSKRVNFNLTTGQPATEADYQAFNDIVGI